MQLGDKRVPVYQPSTIMFNSAVVPDGDLVILVDDVQMNGNILGHAGSIFLAKFCACLAT